MDQSTVRQAIICTCANLRMAARAVTQMYDEALKPVGLRATQFSLLAAVWLHEPVPITPLAEAIVTDRTTLTRNLKLLEKAGYLQTVIGDDKRTRLVQMTDDGRAVLEQAYPLWQDVQAQMVNGIGEASWQQLRQLLTEIVAIAQDN